MRGVLRGEDFTDQRHRALYGVLAEVLDNGLTIERNSVIQVLQRQNSLPRIGGPGYLDALIGAASANPVDVDNSVRILHACTTSRKLMALAQRIQAQSASGQPVQQIITETDDYLHRIEADADTEQDGSLTMMETIRSLPSGLDEFINPYINNPGIKTPWPKLNELVHALHAGEVVIVAARPSQGKSLVAGQIGAYAARNGHQTLFFSHEMSTESIYRRIVIAELGLLAKEVRRGFVSNLDVLRIGRLVTEWARRPELRINSSRGLTLPDLSAVARRHRKKYGLKLVIVDFLQLMRSVKPMHDKNTMFGEIAIGMKQLAKELGICVLLISQLSRAAETRVDKRPQLSDLYMSGYIEQVGDVIVFVHRPGMYQKQGEPPNPDGLLLVAKQREGEIGEVRLRFNGAMLRFENYDGEPLGE